VRRPKMLLGSRVDAQSEAGTGEGGDHFVERLWFRVDRVVLNEYEISRPQQFRHSRYNSCLGALDGSEAIHPTAEIVRLRRDQHPHACRRDDHVTLFTAASTSARLPAAIRPRSRTTTPGISISTQVCAHEEASTFVPIVTNLSGVSAAARPAAEAATVPRAPRVAAEKLLWPYLVPPGDVRHLRARRKRLRHDPGLDLRRPIATPPRARDHLKVAPLRGRRVKRMVVHRVKPILNDRGSSRAT
jgi:hypothetical protein